MNAERKEDGLNAEQRSAAEFKGKHLLVLAGAGTGKTRTIIARAKFLIESGVPENRILILSFTRKSAREIVERIRAEISAGEKCMLRGQTFHSWCSDLIHGNPEVFGQAGFTLLDEDDVQSCFKLICRDGIVDANGHAVQAQQAASIYSYARNTRISLSDAMRIKLGNARLSPEKLDEFIEKSKPAYIRVIKEYMQYKQDRMYMDYDDVLSIVASGLKVNAEARDFIASKYDHILIDEMQDTNPLQYELLANFYEKCHIFCVGDDAQSIYAFRGADFYSIHHFKEVVPEADVCRLTVNYRSTQEILDLSNWLLRQSPLQYKKDLRAARGNGLKPYIVHWNTPWEEANLITDKMIRSLPEKGLSWHDHMVLSRSINGLKQVEGACIKKAIPYVIYGGISLMQSRHIRDLVSAIRIAVNPKDELAWMRYLELWKGIGSVSAAKMLAEILTKDGFDEICAALKKYKIPSELTQTLQIAVQHASEPSRAIQSVLKIMEPTFLNLYKSEWEFRKLDFPILADIAGNCTSLVEFVTEYVLDPKLNEVIKKAGEASNDKVILTTIHSAKGLEATVCHIINVNPECWPAPWAVGEDEAAVEEERRCLYVAMTRAKDELYIYRDVRAARASSPGKKFSTKIPPAVRAKLEAKYNRHSSTQSQAYFLNGLPENLVTRDTQMDNRVMEKTEYHGKMIYSADDFDFS